MRRGPGSQEPGEGVDAHAERGPELQLDPGRVRSWSERIRGILDGEDRIRPPRPDLEWDPHGSMALQENIFWTFENPFKTIGSAPQRITVAPFECGFGQPCRELREAAL